MAIRANETRWNGNYRMVKRYVQFKDALEALSIENTHTGRTVANLLPNRLDTALIMVLYSDLRKLNSASLELQQADGTISLFDVRTLFDKCIKEFGEHFAYHLSPDSEIVHSPKFEKSIIRAIEIGYMGLTKQEKDQVQRLEVRSNVVVINGEDEEEDLDTFGRTSIQDGRKRIKHTMSLIDLRSIPVTSNLVERFFSQVKLSMTSLRNRLKPSTLEALMYLKINSHLMDEFTVQRALSLVCSC
jgi:hypothetical protein